MDFKKLLPWTSVDKPPESRIETFQPPSTEVMEKVLLTGDLSPLTPAQRLNYYESVCRALKLNPLTKPFEYIVLNGKLTLYSRKDCTDQLRKNYGISIRIIARELQDGVFTVVARASMPNGREDESMGAVVLPLTGDARSNAIMKAETKAKRRVTLSICGLGMFDESELDTMQFEANDAQSRVEQATKNRLAEKPLHWEDEIVHFGANMKGKRLGDLDPSQLGWLQKDWKPSSNPSAQDLHLKHVLQTMHSVGEEVTEENYAQIVCHVGKAQGPMLGKTVSEIPVTILQWLHDHYGEGEGRRWGTSGNEKDKRFKQAVDIALSKLE